MFVCFVYVCVYYVDYVRTLLWQTQIHSQTKHQSTQVTSITSFHNTTSSKVSALPTVVFVLLLFVLCFCLFCSTLCLWPIKEDIHFASKTISAEKWIAKCFLVFKNVLKIYLKLKLKIVAFENVEPRCYTRHGINLLVVLISSVDKL